MSDRTDADEYAARPAVAAYRADEADCARCGRPLLVGEVGAPDVNGRVVPLCGEHGSR